MRDEAQRAPLLLRLIPHPSSLIPSHASPSRGCSSVAPRCESGTLRRTTQGTVRPWTMMLKGKGGVSGHRSFPRFGNRGAIIYDVPFSPSAGGPRRREGGEGPRSGDGVQKPESEPPSVLRGPSPPLRLRVSPASGIALSRVLQRRPALRVRDAAADDPGDGQALDDYAEGGRGGGKRTSFIPPLRQPRGGYSRCPLFSYPLFSYDVPFLPPNPTPYRMPAGSARS